VGSGVKIQGSQIRISEVLKPQKGVQVIES
jgi:hypothetical protein